ncbi:MAG: hypothetical protein QXR97_05660 [Thermoproteota archaeon]
MQYLEKLSRVLPMLIRAIIITLVTGLIGIYDPSQPYHYVKNGIPLPFVIQIIDIKVAKYIEIKIEPLFLLLDVLFWAVFLFFLRVSGRILKRIFPSRVKQDVSEHHRR